MEQQKAALEEAKTALEQELRQGMTADEVVTALEETKAALQEEKDVLQADKAALEQQLQAAPSAEALATLDQEKVLACSCSAWARMPPERYRCSVRMPSGAQCPAHIGLPKDGHTYTCEEHLRLGMLGTQQRVAGAGHTMAAAITKRGPARTVADLAGLRRIVDRKRQTGGAKKGPTSRKARAMMPSSLDTGATLSRSGLIFGQDNVFARWRDFL